MGDKPSSDEISLEDSTEGEDKLVTTLESKIDDELLKPPPAPSVEAIDAADDRPTVPKNVDEQVKDVVGGERHQSSPPRPKSVRPPAPLPGPLPGPMATPLSSRPMPPTSVPLSSGNATATSSTTPSSKMPPPPPPRSASRPPTSSGKPLPTPRVKLGSTPHIEIADPDTDEKSALLDIEDDVTRARDPNEPPTVGDRDTALATPDAGPPGIPSLNVRSDDDDEQQERPPKKDRGKKGRRRTVRIPDDDVPSAGLRSDAFGEDEQSTSEEDFDDDRPTFIMPEKDVEEEVRRVTASTNEPAPVGHAGHPHPGGSAPRDAAPESVEPEEEQSDEGTTRKSAPRIFTDELAISVLRPVNIFSDLPSVASEMESGPLSPPVSARRPPPPRRTDRPEKTEPTAESTDGTEVIEEVVPERVSFPSVDAPEPTIGEIDSRPRRPLPPPRSAMASDPGFLAEVEREPTTPAQPTGFDALRNAAPAQPTGFDALRNAEEQLAAAEAAALKAEQFAREAEARAKEAADRAKDARTSDSKRPKKPWYVEMFEDDYIRTLDNPKKKDVQIETTFIEQSLHLDRGSRVLDLACGHGVHAVEMASRGYQVVGVDLSNTMLNLAREYNAKRATSVSLIQGDMRELNLDGVFDGVYCWSSSFGYFDEQRNSNVLERVHRALRPGGRVVLDLLNRDHVAPRSPSMAWFEKPGCVCMDEAKFDFYTSRLVTKRMVMFETGKSRELEMSIRLYTLHELGRLMQKVGFKVLEVSGHRAHRGAYFGCESPRIIICCERKEDEQ